MLQRVNSAAVLPAGQDVQFYDLIARPAARIGHWVLRRRRGVSDREIQATTYGLLADFEELLSLNEFYIRTRKLDETQPEPDEEQEVEGLNALLTSVRRCRGDILGNGGKTLENALKSRLPELGATYIDLRDKVLAMLAEFERAFVLLGAGTEADAELGMPLIPLPDVPPGPTVYAEP